MLANNNFTYYFSKANPSSFSSLAISLLVYLLLLLLKDMGRK